MAAVLSMVRPPLGGAAAVEAGGGEAAERKVAAERSEFLLQCNAIRLRLRLSWKRWALDHADCSPQEWSRFWNLDRRLSKRVEERLLVLHPELRKPWLRSLEAAPPAPPRRARDPGG
jgi:hypothetical protein